METSNNQQYTCLAAIASLLIHWHRKLSSELLYKYAEKYNVSNITLVKIEKCEIVPSIQNLEILSELIGCTFSTVILAIEEISTFLSQILLIELKSTEDYMKLKDYEKANLIEILKAGKLTKLTHLNM